jgi:DNA primase
MWIDYRQLRQDADFPAVLSHYGIEVRMRGNQGQGFCPLPTHNGNRKSPSFSVNFEKKIWQCFGCKARGNVIDLAVRMEGHDPSDTRAVREVSEMLLREFVSDGRHEDRLDRRREPAPVQARGRDDSRPRSASKVLVNPPLDFKLQDLDAEHPYLASRNLKPATIAHFGLGYCSRGMLKDRIAIPLHDGSGKLVGYAGRVVDDDVISEENPKYRFPGRREYHGQVIEFHKSHFLYNGYRVKNARNIVVVEGFMSTFWLWQCGYPQVVSLMGSSCSEQQAELLVSCSADDGTVWVMTDGDDAGVDCGDEVLAELQGRRQVELLKLDDGVQPTDLSMRELRKLIPFGADKSGTSFKPRVGKSRKPSQREV